MKRFAIIIAFPIMLAGCTDSARITEPARAPSTPSFSASPSTAAARVLATRGRDKDLRNASSPNGTRGVIFYHGGPVLGSQTSIVAVYWSANTIYAGGPKPGSSSAKGNGSDGSLVGFFLRNLGGSPYFNINTTYYDRMGVPIANIVRYTGFWANNQSPLVPSGTQSVSDQQMLDMLSYGFQHGYLTYDPSTLYVIFTQGQVNLGGGFGTSYCAYHYLGTVTIDNRGTQKTALYAAMPDAFAYPSACSEFASTPSPNDDKHADAVVNVLAHETEETTTDGFLNAWFDGRGFENADKCAWTFGTVLRTASGAPYNMTLGGKHFLVQRNWVNSGSGYCATAY